MSRLCGGTFIIKSGVASSVHILEGGGNIGDRIVKPLHRFIVHMLGSDGHRHVLSRVITSCRFKGSCRFIICIEFNLTRKVGAGFVRVCGRSLVS